MGPANREVFVVLPKMSSIRGNAAWLLMTAAHDLCNLNAKFQVQSDKFLNDAGFASAPLVPQLLQLKKNTILIEIAFKVVNDILLAGTADTVDLIISVINDWFKLGIIVYRPGKIQYFGININQQDAFAITGNADEKLSNI